MDKQTDLWDFVEDPGLDEWLLRDEPAEMFETALGETERQLRREGGGSAKLTGSGVDALTAALTRLHLS